MGSVSLCIPGESSDSGMADVALEMAGRDWTGCVSFLPVGALTRGPCDSSGSCGEHCGASKTFFCCDKLRRRQQ